MSEPQVGQLVKIGSVAAQNIVRSLDMPVTAAATIEHAIADEINAMSSHFTLAFADIQTAHEVALNTVKADYAKAVSAFTFIKSNKLEVAFSLSGMIGLGALIGRFV